MLSRPSARGWPLGWIALLVAGLLLASCSSDPSSEPESFPSQKASHAGPHYLALAGGGIAAHTLHSGMIMAAMAKSESDLNGTLGNVKSIASTSGGSWFLSQLSYSPKFQEEISKPDAPANWSSTGYVGQLQEAFNQQRLSQTCSQSIKALCQMADRFVPHLTLVEAMGGEDLSWHQVVDDLVFEPWQMNAELAETSLSSPKHAWAKDKTLVFTGAAVNHEVVLEQPADSQLESFASNNSEPSQSVTTPITMAAPASGDSTQSGFASGPVQFSYGPDVTEPTQTTAEHNFSGPLDVAGMKVMDAATVSSAALAATASVPALSQLIPKPFRSAAPELAYEASNLAPAYDLGSMQYAGDRLDPDWNPKDLADNRIVRLADGGYGDNTAAVHILRSLADNDNKDDFNLTIFAFSGAPLDDGPYSGMARFSANLFGYDTENDATQMCMSTCVEVTSSHVFDQEAVSTPEDGWAYQQGDHALSYKEYDVATVENKPYGVRGGQKGTVHLFQLFGATPLLPSNEAAFPQYQALLDTVYQGITEHGGWEHLSEGLGLSQ